MLQGGVRVVCCCFDCSDAGDTDDVCLDASGVVEAALPDALEDNDIADNTPSVDGAMMEAMQS